VILYIYFKLHLKYFGMTEAHLDVHQTTAY